MDKGSILICRNGAYGDILHCSHLPRLLKDQGWDFVGFATGYKGKQLLSTNPFIDIIHFFEPGGREISTRYFHKRNDILGTKYDKTINLIHSIEVGALALEAQDEYYQHQSVRDKMGQENYYDISTRWAGYPELIGKYRGEVFYSDKECSIVEHDLLRPGRYKDNFKLMFNLCGSSSHKVFIQAREVAEQVLNQYPEAVIFTTGAPEVKELDFEDLSSRVRSLVGKKPFRQALLMAKYMDCVIGCESGLMCGASMWDVPTIQLMTCANIYNHCKYATRDYSLQSPAWCSPCFKGPYKYYGCPTKGRLPLCVYFNVKDILIQINRIYAEQYLPSKIT